MGRPEGPRERGGWPSRIGELLPTALGNAGGRGLWTEVRLRRVWAEAVGPVVAANANVGRLRGGSLEVRVTSETWATELRYLAATIVEKLNRVMGEQVVREIVVRRRGGGSR